MDLISVEWTTIILLFCLRLILLYVAQAGPCLGIPRAGIAHAQ